MVKQFSEAQVDDIIKLKFGRLVTSPHHVSYASDARLGRIFGASASKVRQLYMGRFQAVKDQQLPFTQRFVNQM